MSVAPAPPPVTQSAPFVAMLAFVAGSLNVWALMNAGAFATSQTGNLVASAFYLVTGHWDRALFVFGSIVAFGVGTMVSALVLQAGHSRGKQLDAFSLMVEAAFIAVAGILWATRIIPETQYGAHLVCLGIAFTAGAQGNAFHQIAGYSYGNVSITPELQGMFNNLALAIGKRKKDAPGHWMWIKRFFAVLAGFGGGALLGAMLSVQLGWPKTELPGHPQAETGWTLLIPALVTFGLALVTGKANRKAATTESVQPATQPQK